MKRAQQEHCPRIGPKMIASGCRLPELHPYVMIIAIPQNKWVWLRIKLAKLRRFQFIVSIKPRCHFGYMFLGPRPKRVSFSLTQGPPLSSAWHIRPNGSLVSIHVPCGQNYQTRGAKGRPILNFLCKWVTFVGFHVDL